MTTVHKIKTKAPKEFQELIKFHFGNIKEFERVMNISYPTALRYYRNPSAMNMNFIIELANQINKHERHNAVTVQSITKTIGEGEE